MVWRELHGYEQSFTIEPLPSMNEWIDKHHHFPVFLQIVSITELSPTDINVLISRYAILGDLNYIDIY